MSQDEGRASFHQKVRKIDSLLDAKVQDEESKENVGVEHHETRRILCGGDRGGGRWLGISHSGTQVKARNGGGH
jgi:hypothetical protein